MTTATGTSTLGVFVWTLAVTVANWLAAIGDQYLKLRGHKIPNPLERALTDSWFIGVLGLGGVAVLVIFAWAVFTVIVIYREHKALLAERYQANEVLTPLQLKGFELAAEIRDFAMSFGDIVEPPPQVDAKYRTTVRENLQSWIGSYPPEVDAQLRLRLIHGFETRKFRERVEEYMHRMGESGYPILNASGFTEEIFDRRSLCRLAAEIENVAIAVNYFPSPRKRKKQ
jgi:hypothetical protein